MQDFNFTPAGTDYRQKCYMHGLRDRCPLRSEILLQMWGPGQFTRTNNTQVPRCNTDTLSLPQLWKLPKSRYKVLRGLWPALVIIRRYRY